MSIHQKFENNSNPSHHKSDTDIESDEEFDTRKVADWGAWDPPPFLGLAFWGIASRGSVDDLSLSEHDPANEQHVGSHSWLWSLLHPFPSLSRLRRRRDFDSPVALLCVIALQQISG